jgi:tetratricopeptide (TPR) repeat protein
MKLALAVFAVTPAILVSGCSPVASIRPLYTDADLQKPIVEPRIEGEWVSPNTEETEKAAAGEMWLRWKITSPEKPDAPYNTYSAEFRLAKPDPQEGDEASSYAVRLVAMGDKLFFDAEFHKHTKGQLSIGRLDALGLVPAHIVGRIWVQQDFLRIALLRPDWVEKNWPAGIHSFSSSEYGDDDTVITGSTQELRDFLARNADNPKALAYTAYLCRPGTDCANRAAEDALSRSPDDDEVLEAASKFFFARHCYARAATLRRHRVELDPKDFTRHIDLSDALFLSLDFAGARRELAEVLELAQGDHPKPTGYDAQSAYARAIQDIVWSYFLEGKYAEAVSAAKSCKPGEKHYSVSPVLLSYFSLLRLGRREAAESLLNDEIAKFSGSAEEHILLLDARGRVSEGFSYSDPNSEALRRTAFFGGLRDIAIGRLDTARVHLDYAASEHSDSVIALAARIELERLRPEPKK